MHWLGGSIVQQMLQKILENKVFIDCLLRYFITFSISNQTKYQYNRAPNLRFYDLVLLGMDSNGRLTRLSSSLWSWQMEICSARFHPPPKKQTNSHTQKNQHYRNLFSKTSHFTMSDFCFSLTSSTSPSLIYQTVCCFCHLIYAILSGISPSPSAW